MRITVSGAIDEGLIRGIKDFAEDVEASLTHVDKDLDSFIVTVSGDKESMLAELLGELSKVMRVFGLAK